MGCDANIAATRFPIRCEGVCDVCSAPTNISIDICGEHASEGRCDNCGRKWALAVRIRCPVCKKHQRSPPFWIVAWHPDVIEFYNERGAPIQYELDDLETIGGLVGDREQELVADDPPRVQVVYEYDGDRLEVLVDEQMNVLEVTEPD